MSDGSREDRTNPESGAKSANGGDTQRGIGAFFVLAMLPVVLAVLVPATPELLTRLETVKVGGFEAKLNVERLAASAGSTTITSERSSDESYFAVIGWKAYGEMLSRHRAVAKWTEKDVTNAEERHRNIRREFDDLIKPLVGVISCQHELAVGSQAVYQILENFVVLFSPATGMVQFELEPGRELNAALSSRVLLLDRTLESIDGLHGIVRIAREQIGQPLPECSDADFDTLSASVQQLKQLSAIGGPESSSARFRPGYLSIFVAMLIVSQNGSADRGLVQAIRYLDQTAKSVDGFTSMERFNLYRTMGRMMYQARWDIEDVIPCLRLALVEAESLRWKIERVKNGYSPVTSKKIREDAISDQELEVITEFIKYTDEFIFPLILTDLLNAANQYRIEGYMVPDEIVLDAKKWRDDLAERTTVWQPNHRLNSGVTNVSDKVIANASIGVAMYDIITESRSGELQATTCSRAMSVMTEVQDFWRTFEIELRNQSEYSQIGLFQGPIVLSQRYRGYIASLCRDAKQ